MSEPREIQTCSHPDCTIELGLTDTDLGLLCGLHMQHAKDIIRGEERLLESEARLAEMQAEIEELKTKRTMAKLDHLIAVEDRERLMAEKTELQDNLRQMTDCRDDLKRLVAQMNTELAELEREIERLKNFISEADEPDGSLMWTSDHAKILDRETTSLREQLARLQWRPITETDLPSRGDEALELGNETHGPRVIPVGFDKRDGDCERYTHAGYTHFRAINAPEAK